MNNIKAERRNGECGASIEQNKYGIEIMTMINGFQWSGMPINEEVLDMLESAIQEFKRNKAAENE